MDQAPLEFHPEAIAEARSAREWYAERNEQAAERFIAELDEAIESIRNAPHQWPAFLFGTRSVILRKFPYIVVYEQIDQTVHVVAVAHAKRQPGYWSDRLKD